jgi:hypothetical protein
MWWLVFRLEFGAGMIKIRGGREWRDLTALMYHHVHSPRIGANRNHGTISCAKWLPRTSPR